MLNSGVEMKKVAYHKIVSLALALAFIAFVLSGCAENSVAFSTSELVSESIVIPPSSTDSGTPIADSSDASSEPLPGIDLELNPTLAQLITGTNGDVKAALDGDMACSSTLYGGGVPVAIYVDATTNSDIEFWLTLLQEVPTVTDEWKSANCFADDFNVEQIRLRGEGNFLNTLFIGEAERSIENISICLAQTPTEEVSPGSPPEGLDYYPERLTYTYTLDNMILVISFDTDTNAPYDAWIRK